MQNSFLENQAGREENGESLERHTSDCVKILMKLKLFITNTGEVLLRRLNYTKILAEFLHVM